MAEDSDNDGDSEEGGAAEAAPAGGKKKLILLIGVALLLVIGGIAGAYFTGLMQPLIEMFAGGKHEEVAEVEEEPPGTEVVFYELPELLVNLNTGERKATFLKIRVSLELGNATDVPKIEQLMPRIVDNFQVYLRELRIEDLKGSAGVYRLREELMTRVSAAVAPVRVNDVLFKEMLIQ